MSARRGRPGTRASVTAWLPLIAILLLATAVRFYHLDAQSFWNDEGNTARLIERPIRLIIEGTAGDIHPPGYYLLLAAWRLVAGQSEFALRSFSVLCGIAMVAVTAAIARQAARRGAARHRAAGWLPAYGAAALVALHPLAVYYSQEARMYAQLGFVSILTLLAAMALVRRTAGLPTGSLSPGGQARRLVLPTLALGLCMAAGLYTQYTYVLPLAGLNLAFALDWLPRRPRRWRTAAAWATAHGIAALLFLPWAPIALRASAWRPPDLASGEALRAMARTLITGIGQTGAGAVALGLGAAALLGLLALWSALGAPLSRSARFARLAALLMALAPPLLIAAAGIYRPAYLKFLTAAIGPLAVALAMPLAWIGTRPLGQAPTAARDDRAPAGSRAWLLSAGIALLLVGLLWIEGRATLAMTGDPTLQRDDYRGIAAAIRAEGRPGDAIVLDAPNQWEVFTYYYRAEQGDPLPVYPAPYRPTEAEAAAWVDGIVRQHTRLFVLYWGDLESDPERWIERALAERAYKAGDTWVDTVRVARYGTGPAPDSPDSPLDVCLGACSGIRLEGYGLGQTDFRPGDVVPVALFWTTAQAPDGRYKVFVHLIDAEGALVAQADAEPQAGFRPTDTWQPDETIPDHYGLWLPTDLPPGRYTVRVGMYALSGERLPVLTAGVAGGDTLDLREITVTGTP